MPQYNTEGEGCAVFPIACIFSLHLIALLFFQASYITKTTQQDYSI